MERKRPASARLAVAETIVEGACESCGFLALRGVVDDIDLGNTMYVEFDRNARKRGAGYAIVGSSLTTKFNAKPFCLLGAAQIEAEVEREVEESGEDRNVALVSVISRGDRKCPKWYKHKMGLSPERHLEETRAIEAAEKREKWEEGQEKLRREDARFHRKSERKEVWIIGICALVLAAVSIVVEMRSCSRAGADAAEEQEAGAG
ncbi:MAG: hypothetical protein IH985_03770 [Planctomycetes bacterium]|nr:hypothetical protein [Planctomycetota bacterium]